MAAPFNVLLVIRYLAFLLGRLKSNRLQIQATLYGPETDSGILGRFQGQHFDLSLFPRNKIDRFGLSPAAYFHLGRLITAIGQQHIRFLRDLTNGIADGISLVQADQDMGQIQIFFLIRSKIVQSAQIRVSVALFINKVSAVLAAKAGI